MDYTSMAERIINLRDTDLKLRYQLLQNGELTEGYHTELEELHNSHARTLREIMDTIGYPTIDNVGKEASEAAWLIIQHAIGQPEFMKKCAELLSQAVQQQQADPKNLAYLTDRIAVFEGKPQRYGTQFDWDENGEMSPNQVDEVSQVNQRRQALGLNTLEEQTVLMRKRVKDENQRPPADFITRKRIYDDWRKAVGWIT